MGGGCKNATKRGPSTCEVAFPLSMAARGPRGHTRPRSAHLSPRREDTDRGLGIHFGVPLREARRYGERVDLHFKTTQPAPTRDVGELPCTEAETPCKQVRPRQVGWCNTYRGRCVQ